MTDEESLILHFLRSSPESYFTRREIARKAVRRNEYEENPHWVTAPLAALVAAGQVETNEGGLYRLKQRTLRL